MKKIHIIEAVIDFFDSDQAGERKAKYHPEIVKTHLNNMFNQIIYATWLNGKKFSDFSQLDSWSKTYVCAVLDQSGANAYALLPFAPVQLPDGMGIRQVSDTDDSSTVFAPIEATSNVVFAELEVDDVDDTPTFRLQQNNISAGAGQKSHLLRLERLPIAPATLITNIDAMLIVPMDQMDDYDDVVIPGMQDDTIVRQVIDLMSKKPNPDTANDSVITNN